MDHALADGDSTEVCARLKARGIPYVTYSGYDPVEGTSPDAPQVSKPATMDILLSTLEALLPRLPRIATVRPRAATHCFGPSDEPCGSYANFI